MLKITIQENGSVRTNEPMRADQFINATLTAQWNIFQDILKRAQERTNDPDQVELLREELYDMYNEAASVFLEQLIPDNIRPDLTAEAILAAENAILDSKVKTVDTHTKELVQSLKDEFKKDGLLPDGGDSNAKEM